MVSKSENSSHSVWLFYIGLIVAAIAGLFVIYFPTVKSVVTIWNSSETFAHGYLIVPISIWLIWRLRHQLALSAPVSQFHSVPLILLASFGWLVSYLVDVQVVQQLALVFMIPLIVYALLGWQLTRQILFPLFFLFLAVPMGEALIPYLIDFTADFTVAMVQLTGIPIYREGTFFQLPSGNWSVVTACSGVRYLIASVTLGFLYAYLNYQSNLKRAVFILFSILVPIFANGLRAFMIVMIGHFSDMQLATGVDHLIYGWVFFGLVIAIMFYVGSFWRDDEIENNHHDGDVPKETDSCDKKRGWLVFVAIIAAYSLAPIFAYSSNSEKQFSAVKIQKPDIATWEVEEKSLTQWEPDYLGLDAKQKITYQKANAQVELFIGHYVWQRKGAQLITSVNTLVSEKNKDWRLIKTGSLGFSINGKKLVSPLSKIQSNGKEYLVLPFMFINGEAEVNQYKAKLLEAKARLLQGKTGSSIVVFITPIEDDIKQAKIILKEFIEESKADIYKALNTVKVVY